MTGSVPFPDGDPVASTPSASDAASLAARRARLRGTLARRRISEEQLSESSSETSPASSNDISKPEAEITLNAPEHKPQVTEAALDTGAKTSPPEPTPTTDNLIAAGADKQPNASTNRLTPSALGSITDVAALLTSIDQTMTACAVNLANLQKIASEQAEALKQLGETFQNRDLHGAGMNLSSLSESFSAALEPMKAVGKLVPAIDQLSHAMSEHIHKEEKVNPDILVTNLADQLASGSIDPWTFKCAYTAIFPNEQPADLLRGLVELLGTQKLSGDLFRAAYEAVQAAERPAPTIEPGQPEDQAKFDALRKAHEELGRTLKEREKEFEHLLVDKDRELQEVQEQLNTRYDEFNQRYTEVTEALSKREEEYRALLENKDMEISDRESELEMLRSQMEELRSQTQEMVTDLQRQVVNAPPAKPEVQAPAKTPEPVSSPTPAPKSHVSAGFFDTAQTSGSKSFYENGPAMPAYVKPQTADQPLPAPASAQAPAAPAVQPQQLAAHQAGAAVRAAAGGAGAGRHGTGVRAQVFEVIVRQALAGAPWREICAGPMQVNSITPEEVEAEVKRRKENKS